MSSVFHLDLGQFRAVIEEAVAAAMRRIRSERPADAVGKKLLTKQETAKALGISVSTLDRLTHPRGHLRAIRLDGRVLYSPSTIDSWIKMQEGGEE